jgi:hypothetical protein
MKAITTQRCSTVGQRPPPARNNGRKTLTFKDQSRGSALLEPMEQPRLPREDWETKRLRSHMRTRRC